MRCVNKIQTFLTFHQVVYMVIALNTVNGLSITERVKSKFLPSFQHPRMYNVADALRNNYYNARVCTLPRLYSETPISFNLRPKIKL